MGLNVLRKDAFNTLYLSYLLKMCIFHKRGWFIFQFSRFCDFSTSGTTEVKEIQYNNFKSKLLNV